MAYLGGFSTKTAKIHKKRCWSYIDTFVSGSPIIQNGMLVGAITHVFLDDSTEGYGIFAENMIDTAQSVKNEYENVS